jgi:16S rRNA (cytosine967-C5)-methyltransferase
MQRGHLPPRPEPACAHPAPRQPGRRSRTPAAGIVLEPGELLTAARTVVSGDVTATEAFREGRVRLQDEGSQLVAELAAENPQPKSEKQSSTLRRARRKDAHPGRAQPASPHRRHGIQRAAAGAVAQAPCPSRDRIECRLADATALTEDSAFDLALADVPCSGTGTLGRNPEIRHRLRPEDLARQAERQRAILTAALRAVRPGGRVVYSTCSLEPEENEQVVAAVLAATPTPARFRSKPASKLCSAKAFSPRTGAERLRACLTPEGALRLLPGALSHRRLLHCMIDRLSRN